MGQFDNMGLVDVSSNELIVITGGIDKKVKDALYAFGYVLGVAARYIGIFGKRIVDTVKSW